MSTHVHKDYIIHAYIHTYIHTYIHVSHHAYIRTRTLYTYAISYILTYPYAISYTYAISYIQICYTTHTHVLHHTYTYDLSIKLCHTHTYGHTNALYKQKNDARTGIHMPPEAMNCNEFIDFFVFLFFLVCLIHAD